MDCEIIRAEVVQRSVSSEPGHGGAPDLIALDTLVHARRSWVTASWCCGQNAYGWA